LPHAPQLAASVWESTHLPPHVVSPPLQTHMPCTHEAPDAHTPASPQTHAPCTHVPPPHDTPHAPQWSWLVLVSTQLPLHIDSEVRQVPEAPAPAPGIPEVDIPQPAAAASPRAAAPSAIPSRHDGWRFPIRLIFMMRPSLALRVGACATPVTTEPAHVEAREWRRAYLSPSRLRGRANPTEPLSSLARSGFG
jgi:hypothetical protein